MKRSFDGKRIRIYFADGRRLDGRPLQEVLVEEALRHDLSGATVFRGTMGFGRHHHVHTANILRLSDELPVCVEIIEEAGKADAFVTWMEDRLQDCLVTVEDLRVTLLSGRDRT